MGTTWCKVLREKYGVQGVDGFQFVEKQRDLKVWKEVMRGAGGVGTAQVGCKMEVRGREEHQLLVRHLA